MTKRGRPFGFMGLVVFTAFAPIAMGGMPGIWRTAHALMKDNRVVKDRRGNSGGPLYGDFNGQKHIVIGMTQSIRGNGIDVSESSPNIQVLFTPDTLARISAAQALTPCP
jgi:hypothetical protein